MNTSERILEAAMNLFSEKSYKSVTTKEIAAKAEISEMTVFRHFENKRNLFEKAFEKYIFNPNLQGVFEHKIVWDLEKDLLLISKVYQETLAKNKKIMIMQFKDSDIISEIDTPLIKFPNRFKEILTSYFESMKVRGVIQDDPEIIARNFLAANFGIFISFFIIQDEDSQNKINDSINSLVKVFAKGLST